MSCFVCFREHPAEFYDGDRDNDKDETDLDV